MKIYDFNISFPISFLLVLALIVIGDVRPASAQVENVEAVLNQRLSTKRDYIVRRYETFECVRYVDDIRQCGRNPCLIDHPDRPAAFPAPLYSAKRGDVCCCPISVGANETRRKLKVDGDVSYKIVGSVNYSRPRNVSRPYHTEIVRENIKNCASSTNYSDTISFNRTGTSQQSVSVTKTVTNGNTIIAQVNAGFTYGSGTSFGGSLQSQWMHSVSLQQGVQTVKTEQVSRSRSTSVTVGPRTWAWYDSIISFWQGEMDAEITVQADAKVSRNLENIQRVSQVLSDQERTFKVKLVLKDVSIGDYRIIAGDQQLTAEECQTQNVERFRASGSDLQSTNSTPSTVNIEKGIPRVLLTD